MATTMLADDNDNNVDGDGMTGNEVDDDGDGRRATTRMTTMMVTMTNDGNGDDGDGNGTMGSGATGDDEEDDGDGRRRRQRLSFPRCRWSLSLRVGSAVMRA